MQMSAKKGTKKFGELSIAAVKKEFTLLDQGAVPEHKKTVVMPIDLTMLTYYEKKRDAVNNLKKRDGRIKG